MISRRALLASLPAAALATSARADAPQTYIFSNSVDFTGPFADVMPSWHSGHRAMVAWWNDTVGKRDGVQVVLKVHDLRYDTAVTAQTWPSILATDKPVLHLGMGTPDLVALMKRLPEDHVPMTMPTAMVGLVWAPNGWDFSFRPTYSHEFAALFSHLQATLPDQRPLRIGTVSTQGRAGYEDQVNGVVHLAKMYPDRFVIADQQWVDDAPVDATDQVRRMGAKQPDVVMIGATTAQVIAVARARRDLGISLPIASSSHNGLTEVAKAIPLAELEGDFSVFSFAPYNQPELEAADIFKKYHTEGGSWGIVAAQSAAQTVLSLRMLEAAIGTAGKNAVTGQAMYDALLARPYSEADMLGLTPALQFDKTRPFPIGEIKAKALTVRKGEIIPLTADWMPAPELTKW
jgi:branched-chain amino acid transport system substrate-binding protein